MKRIITAILLFAFLLPLPALAQQYSVTSKGSKAYLYLVNGYATFLPVMVPVSNDLKNFTITLSKDRRGSISLTAHNTIEGWQINGLPVSLPGEKAGIAFDFSTGKAYAIPSELVKRIADNMTSTDRLRLNQISGKDAGSDMQLILVDADRLRAERYHRFAMLNADPAEKPVKLVTAPVTPIKINDKTVYSTGVVIIDRPVITAAANGQIDMLAKLLENGADINETDPANGYNALMAAIRADDPTTPAYLLSKGIDPRHVNSYGQNALHIAAEEGDYAAAQALLGRGLNPNIKDNGGNTPLMYSAVSPNPQLVDLLIRQGARVNDNNNDNISALAFAASNGNTRSVDLLISKGANVNAADNHGKTVLLQAVDTDNRNIISRLVAAGADINAKDNSGNTPLTSAVIHANIPVAEELLKAGANQNEQNDLGRTPLMLAAAAGNKAMLEVILKYKPDLFTIDDNGETAYTLSIQYPATATVLTSAIRSADDMVTQLFDRVSANDIPAVEKLLKNGVRLNMSDIETGNTAIFAAVANNYKDMTALLIKNNADLNRQNKRGNSPLTVAVSTGDEKLVNMLLKAGANPNIQNNTGDTPLIWAVKLQRFEIVRALLIGGANPNLRNFDGVSPLSVAEGESMGDIVRILKSSGAF